MAGRKEKQTEPVDSVTFHHVDRMPGTDAKQFEFTACGIVSKKGATTDWDTVTCPQCKVVRNQSEVVDTRPVHYLPDVMQQLVARAKQVADGHLTIMKFTTNWRVGFGTVTDYIEISELPVGSTFEEAAIIALRKGRKRHGK